MLKKAMEDDIVVTHTNLYSQFFDPKNQGNMKITAARLPYFDGDYWSSTAQIVSKKLEEEERSGGSRSKSPTRRSLVGIGPENPTKDVLVMQRVNIITYYFSYTNFIGACYCVFIFLIFILILLQLRQNIKRYKENFMIVRLQHMCTYCHEVILSGSRWFCSQCNQFQLCSRYTTFAFNLGILKLFFILTLICSLSDVLTLWNFFLVIECTHAILVKIVHFLR